MPSFRLSAPTGAPARRATLPLLRQFASKSSRRW